MLKIATFTFGPFQENTYLLYNQQGDCLVIDPGCHSASEEQQLASFIAENKLKPVQLINTHGHVDHILGNKFIHDKFGLSPYIHEADMPMFNNLEAIARMYGVSAAASPQPEGHLHEGDRISIGKDNLDVIFTPGHSPGHISLLHREQGFLISGDVLFYESIGRTDLPGGNFDTLMESIKTKLLTLGDHLEVYSGHGPVTTIGHEKLHNPFIQ